mgnify:CR=1 FL=1|jgi:iron-sulfur cluster assembly protein
MVDAPKKDIADEIITITETAANRVKAILKADGKEDHGLRLNIVGGGCSGLSYNLSFDNQTGEFDRIFEQYGVKIYIDLKAWLYLRSSEVDFSDDLLSGGFKINNPNAQRSCGCGTSFSV